MIVTAEIENNLLALVQKYPDTVLKVWAIEWEKHIHNNFDTAGQGEWQKKYIDDGRAILTGKTGLLKSGTHVEADLHNHELIAATSVDYGQIHQEGGTIPVTAKMRKWFWAQYKETKNDKWKKLALTKKDHFTVPKREYINVTDSLINTFVIAAEEILKLMVK